MATRKTDETIITIGIGIDDYLAGYAAGLGAMARAYVRQAGRPRGRAAVNTGTKSARTASEPVVAAPSVRRGLRGVPLPSPVEEVIEREMNRMLALADRVIGGVVRTWRRARAAERRQASTPVPAPAPAGKENKAAAAPPPAAAVRYELDRAAVSLGLATLAKLSGQIADQGADLPTERERGIGGRLKMSRCRQVLAAVGERVAVQAAALGALIEEG